MNKKAPTKRSPAKSEPEEIVHSSGGNVFADLGLPHAAEHLAKAELAHQICLLIKDARLSQKEAAARLGVDQPKISALMRGRLADFSTERLMRFVIALNHDVVIKICEPEDNARPSVRVLVET
ncbi:MAG TPA: helix-turn-helix transcriptional regulator [Tepidisphaeraceae bacterium]|jgi:predicted XRE-type DNA-binding protein|nr:helix-turn-helix transcriptional regulator [Tepidisphaeraceae bacterium]